MKIKASFNGSRSLRQRYVRPQTRLTGVEATVASGVCHDPKLLILTEEVQFIAVSRPCGKTTASCRYWPFPFLLWERLYVDLLFAVCHRLVCDPAAVG